jgi:ABC-type lipoprotein release transport system permease subunit
MMSLKLALRNLLGAGLRTWLNVVVLSFSYVIIIWYQGLIDGWNLQARRDMIAWEIAQGQFWHEAYDPFDLFTLEESHTKIPDKLAHENVVPILIAQGTIYPEGRIQGVVLKGIPRDQQILNLPTEMLVKEDGEIPVLIGRRMATNNKLKEGDYLTLRWRDANGTFDATEVKIAGIFKTDVPSIDKGHVWLALDDLQQMTQSDGEATMIVAGPGVTAEPEVAGWDFKSQDFLLADLNQIIKQKSVGGSIMYILLLLLAMLAIFDTQILSIFRRQKEIGTFIALGMTRKQVVRLFTLEGAMNSVLAALVGAAYGVPLLIIQNNVGYAMPYNPDDLGIAISEVIYPSYSFGLILGTILVVMITATIVSYMPARKIARMNPTDAIKGKIQ